MPTWNCRSRAQARIGNKRCRILVRVRESSTRRAKLTIAAKIITNASLQKYLSEPIKLVITTKTLCAELENHKNITPKKVFGNYFVAQVCRDG